LSRYATKEVAKDKKKQELFLYGLVGSLPVAKLRGAGRGHGPP
jgi:hypothetical protein